MVSLLLTFPSPIFFNQKCLQTFLTVGVGLGVLLASSGRDMACCCPSFKASIATPPPKKSWSQGGQPEVRNPAQHHRYPQCFHEDVGPWHISAPSYSGFSCHAVIGLPWKLHVIIHSPAFCVHPASTAQVPFSSDPSSEISVYTAQADFKHIACLSLTSPGNTGMNHITPSFKKSVYSLKHY